MSTQQHAAVYPALNTRRRNGIAVFISVCCLFLSFLSSTINGVLIPLVQDHFALRYASVILIHVSFYLAYMVGAPLAGWVMSRHGFRISLFAGALTAGFGALGLAITGGLESYVCHLLNVFLLGTAVAFLQAVGSSYTLLLGSGASGASRLTMVLGFGGLGCLAAPLLLWFSEGGYVASMQLTYTVLAALWFGVAALLALNTLPERETPVEERLPIRQWMTPRIAWVFCAVFLYVGGEVAIEGHLIRTLTQADLGGFSRLVATRISMLFWGGFAVGRILLGFGVVRNIPARWALIGCAALSSVALFTATFASGTLALIALIATGTLQGIIFPTLFSIGLKGCRKGYEQAGAFLLLADLGACTIPLLQGFAADSIGVHRSFFVPALVYLAVLWIGWHVAFRTRLPTNRVQKTSIARQGDLIKN